MAINKLALIRYKLIDACLRNRLRKWTLDDLIEYVSETLREREGIRNGVSKRTIQGDIQVMRSDKLGYNAPIEIANRKYYYYADENFSIIKAPISEADTIRLKEMIELLKQFSAFQYLGNMSEMIAGLEDTLHSSTSQNIHYVHFEENKRLKGLHFITPLYQSVRNKRAITITYQSFKAKGPITSIYYPYLLKEYRNRWFLICRPQQGTNLLNLALDRMQYVAETPEETFIDYEGVNFERYFSDLIGVTKNRNDRAQKVLLEVNSANAPYIMTKPLHHSQQIIAEIDTGVIIRIDVVLNFELEREILSFGEAIKVIAPKLLVNRIKTRLHQGLELYR